MYTHTFNFNNGGSKSKLQGVILFKKAFFLHSSHAIPSVDSQLRVDFPQYWRIL